MVDNNGSQTASYHEDEDQYLPNSGEIVKEVNRPRQPKKSTTRVHARKTKFVPVEVPSSEL